MSKEKEMVNHPQHYQGNKYEVIDIIEDFDLNFCLGNAIKYILRAGKKGNKNEDILKAIWYLNRELNKNLEKIYCPICGKKLENKEQQVCKECEKKIPWGSNISEYQEKSGKLYCPICGNKKGENDEVCSECSEKYFSEGYLDVANYKGKWHIYEYDKPKDGEYFCKFKVQGIRTKKITIEKGWLQFKNGEQLSKSNILEIILWYEN